MRENSFNMYQIKGTNYRRHVQRMISQDEEDDDDDNNDEPAAADEEVL